MTSLKACSVPGFCQSHTPDLLWLMSVFCLACGWLSYPLLVCLMTSARCCSACSESRWVVELKQQNYETSDFPSPPSPTKKSGLLYIWVVGCFFGWFVVFKHRSYRFPLTSQSSRTFPGPDQNRWMTEVKSSQKENKYQNETFFKTTLDPPLPL